MARDEPVFSLVPRRRLVGLSFGDMTSARRGAGSDVAGSRPYVPGDDMRAIDWAASARLASARATDDFVIRERFADEAPRVVVVLDHRPSMSLYPHALPWLSKPRAVARTVETIVESTLAARGFLGYLDLAEPEPLWRPPRTQRALPEAELERPYRAPSDAVRRAFDHLRSHRRALPPGTFVFVLSDFLDPPPDDVWIEALDRRWDVVPVVIQDPVWEQSFPDVSGVVVPFADPRDGGIRTVRLSSREVVARRDENAARLASLLQGFRAFELEPVRISSDEPLEILNAFLDWSDWRWAARRRSW
jgi:uncharacterized protein (DUF58 family)